MRHAPRAFHYNVRLRSSRRRSPLPVVMAISVVLAIIFLAPRVPLARISSATQELQYESWHPPKGHTRAATDSDLEQLQAWFDETNEEMYAGTFPKIRIEWAPDHGSAYAYAMGEQIRFVRSKFYPDWSGNRDVVLHEMAHVASGRDHDILWDQERARLAEGRRIMTFDQVRKASGSAGS